MASGCANESARRQADAQRDREGDRDFLARGHQLHCSRTGSGCSGAALTCVVTVSQGSAVTARFTAPQGAGQLAQALLGGLTLSAEEEKQLDRFGNNDGKFNLGDLLALLDRTGASLAPSVLSPIAGFGHGGGPQTPSNMRRVP